MLLRVAYKYFIGITLETLTTNNIRQFIEVTSDSFSGVKHDVFEN